MKASSKIIIIIDNHTKKSDKRARPVNKAAGVVGSFIARFVHDSSIRRSTVGVQRVGLPGELWARGCRRCRARQRPPSPAFGARVTRMHGWTTHTRPLLRGCRFEGAASAGDSSVQAEPRDWVSARHRMHRPRMAMGTGCSTG